MSVQVKRRRDTAANLASFTGAQAELLVDTTNNRVQVHDGATPGGWPAAKLAEVVTNERTAVSDANYAALSTDRTIAYTAITAARTVNLPAAASYPTGTALTVFDESGSCSAANTITLSRAGSDTIDGATSISISTAYGYLALQSNGANKWTIVDRDSSNLPGVGIGTPLDPNNALSVYGASALFSGGGNFNVTLNKAAVADTASFIFEDNFSGRGQIGLCGDDNFHFKVSSDGSTWNNAIKIDAATGAVSFGSARTAVSDAAYTALTTDRSIAYVTLSAARVVTLPAAASYPTGTPLVVFDESGSCSATNTITLLCAGTDTLDGATSAVISSPYGYLALQSNGANKWTIVDQAASAAGTGVSSINALSGALSISAGLGLAVSASGTAVTVANTSLPGGLINKFRNATMDVWQRGTSLTATTSGAYTADGWIVLPTGASVAVAQAGARLLTKCSLQVTGAASVTDVIVKQRIESTIAAGFCSQTVTVQAQVYNNTGYAITPLLTVKHAGSQDIWSSPVTDVSAVSLQSCTNGAWTQVAYTFSASASSYGGLEIGFDFGNNFGANTKSIQITELDIRVTPGAATGLNNAPPPPELRPIGPELNFCQRYFQSSYNSVAPGTATSVGELTILVLNGTDFYTLGFVQLPVTMREVPTYTMYSAHTGIGGNMYDNNASADLSGVSFDIANPGSFYVRFPSGGMTPNHTMSGQWTASAEL